MVPKVAILGMLSLEYYPKNILLQKWFESSRYQPSYWSLKVPIIRPGAPHASKHCGCYELTSSEQDNLETPVKGLVAPRHAE